MHVDLEMSRMKRFMLFGLMAAITVSLLFGPVIRPAQAQQDEPTQVVANTVVDVQQADQCTAAGCRPVTFDAAVILDAEQSRGLTEEQAAAAQRELDNANFDRITVTDAAGNEMVVEDGGTLCLQPGNYTVTASLVNEGDVKSAVAQAVNGLGANIDANDIVINDASSTFFVPPCGAPGQPAPGQPAPGQPAPGQPAPDSEQPPANCTQVQAALGEQGGQYGDAFSDADGDASASVASISQELGISQEAVQNCIIGDGNVVGDIDGDGTVEVATADGVDNDGDGAVDEADGTEASASASAGSAAAAGASVLPDTGGASLFTLGAGALLVGGGLLARRLYG